MTAKCLVGKVKLTLKVSVAGTQRLCSPPKGESLLCVDQVRAVQAPQHSSPENQARPARGNGTKEAEYLSPGISQTERGARS